MPPAEGEQTRNITIGPIALEGVLGAQLGLARLPGPLRRLEPCPYAVEIGASLRSLAAQLDRNENAVSAPPP